MFALAGRVRPTACRAGPRGSDSVGRRRFRALHIVAVWGFAYLAVLQLTRLLDVERGVALLLPVVPAVVLAFLYLRLAHSVRSFRSRSCCPSLSRSGSWPRFRLPLTTRRAPRSGASPVPVVLVTFDELPVSSLLLSDGSLDAARYPNFARLALRDVVSASDRGRTSSRPRPSRGSSPESTPGMSTPTLADHRENLFTLLGERYAMHVNEQRTRLCPSRYCPRMAHRAPLRRAGACAALRGCRRLPAPRAPEDLLAG